MIARFKPAGRIALLLSAAILVSLCCFTFTRAAEKKTESSNNGTDASQSTPNTAVGQDSQAPSVLGSSQEILKRKFDELRARVHANQEDLDELGQKYGIAGLGADGKIAAQETIRQLEMARIKAKSDYEGLTALQDQLKKMSGRELQQALLSTIPDEVLGQLIKDLSTTEATIAGKSTSFGPNSPEITSLVAMRDGLHKNAQERITGILNGLRIKVDAAKAQLESIGTDIQRAKIREAEMAAKYRSYSEAARDLESLQKVRDAIYLKMLQEEYGVQAPKGESSKE